MNVGDRNAKLPVSVLQKKICCHCPSLSNIFLVSAPKSSRTRGMILRAEMPIGRHAVGAELATTLKL